MARSPGTKAAAAPASDPRTAILDSFLALLAQKPFERIALAEVATGAGVSLAELRAGFGSTFDMLSAFLRQTDGKVLAGAGEGGIDDMDGESARDRLFDVLMRRLDVLAPHKAAIRSLAESARRNPFFALALNRLSVRSQQWMLAAAKIDTAGARGAVRAQGLALVFARVMRTYLSDDEPELARTMAALDRELARGERMLGIVEGAARLAFCRRHRTPTAEAQAQAPPPDAPVVA